MAVSRRLWGVALAAMAPLWLFAGLASGRSISGIEGARHTSNRDTNSERRPLKYYVLQVLGVTGQVSFEVVGDMNYREKLRSYEDEYKKAGDDWMKQKLEAKKHKEEFNTPPPKGPKFMQKLSQSFRKEADAREYADKMQKQWDEALEKKLAKKEAAGKEETKEKEEAKKE